MKNKNYRKESRFEKMDEERKKNIILVTFIIFVKLLKALRAKHQPKES